MTKNLKWTEHKDKCEEILRSYAAHGKLPTAHIDGESYTPTQYLDACKRVYNYVKKNKTLPPKVWWYNTPSKSAFHQAVEKAVGTYTTFTEYYNRIKAKSWTGYYNDVYNQQEEIRRLANNQSLNCTDHSQLGMAVAKDLGYTAVYCRVTCRSGGHIILKVKGKELGNTYVNVDLAAAASSNYNIGSYWCSSYAKPVVINESWINTDDGRT